MKDNEGFEEWYRNHGFRDPKDEQYEFSDIEEAFEGGWNLAIDWCKSKQLVESQFWIRKPQWISVKDRFPDKSGWYLVYDNSCMMVDTDYINILESGEVLINSTMTHWMPLPEPPEE